MQNSRSVDSRRGQAGHLLRSIQNWAIAGAAAQIARQRLLRALAIQCAAAGVVLVHAKHAHHKARCAEPALRAVALHQRLLNGVQIFALGQLNVGVLRQVFNGPQRHAVNRVRQPNAAVDGLVAQMGLAAGIARAFTQYHGACAAVTFAAAFFGAGAVQIFAQHLQQSTVRWNVMQCHGLTTAQKLDRA